MAEPAARGTRKDAARNREQLLIAAREVFAETGPDAPLEEVAKAADVSRTTLYRNFESREQLAASVFESNVEEIEARAAAAGTSPHGIVQIFDLILTMQLENQALARVLSGADVVWFAELSRRTAHALEPLLSTGRAAGVVTPGTDVTSLLMALHMSSAAVSGYAFLGREDVDGRIREMLHRALFAGLGAPTSAAGVGRGSA